MATSDEDARRWRPRPRSAAALRAGVVLVPLAAGVAVGLLVGRLVPDVDGVLGTLLWWAAVVAATVATLLVVDRLARRLLPLAALLRLSMLFPDEAPSRVRVARRGLGTRAIAAEVAEHRSDGQDDRDHHDDLPRAALTEAQRRGLAGTRQEAAETILGLVTALTDHDRRTRGHSERVHVYVSVLAEEMGLPPDDRDRLVWAALVHDVGKLVVPLEILNKPARPTADEWEVLEAHPAAGAALCEPLREWLGPWFGAVGEHHEKFDGSGYPAGLAGEDISLAARIVAVADAYEVMTADRPYSRATSPAAARDELVRCAGSHFDPTVVRAFLGVPVRRLRLLPAPLAVLAQLPFAPRPAAASSAALGASGAVVAVVTAALLTGVAPSTSPAAPDVASGAPGVVTGDGGSGGAGGDGQGTDDVLPAVPDETPPATAPTDPAPTAADPGRTGAGDGTGSDARPGADRRTTRGTRDAAVRTTAPVPPAPAPAPTAPAVAPPGPSAPTAEPPPQGPTEETVEASTPEDIPVRVRVLEGPRSADGGPVRLVGVGEPSIGTARVEGNAVRYTPDPDATGTDVFPYHLEDGDGRRTEGLMRITVLPVDDPPRPVDDEAVTDVGKPVVLAPARNDRDPDGDPLRVVEVGQPSHGTTELLPGGRVRYTPADGYSGDDAFSYVVDDGTSTAVGEVRLLVTEPAREGTLWLRGRGNEVRRATAGDAPRDLSRNPPAVDRTDWDADGRPGLTLAEDVVERWDFPVRDERLVLDGPVRMLVRSRVPDAPAPQGWSARLEDCAPDGRCLAIAEAGDPYVDPWTTSDTWDLRVLDLGTARAVVPQGHVLRLGFAFSVTDGYLALDRRDPTTLGLTVRPLEGATSLEGTTGEGEGPPDDRGPAAAGP